MTSARVQACSFFLCTLSLGLALASAGCANGSGTGGRDAGTTLRDGEVPPPNTACGPAGERCCAGSTCELGLRCSRDVCCVQAGSTTRCDSASDCCTGLQCSGGVCTTPRGGTCSGSGDCATGLVCHMGVCASPEGGDLPPGSEGCGGMSGVCCPGFVCRSGLVCTGGTCGGCGDEGESCCDGATPCTSTSLACLPGSSPGTTRCTRVPAPGEECGTIDRPACGMDGLPTTGGDCAGAVCEGDLRCVGGMCLNPDDEGGMGQPCGPRGGCDGMLICTYGGDVPVCQPTPEGCGRDMQMCCDTGSTAGGTCEGALHCQTGGCTTCAGPSITCVLGGLLPGEQCCNGAVCRPSPLVPRCCVGAGETCINSADCCGFMMCQDGMCSAGREGSFCISDAECGEGLTCQTFTCQPDAASTCTPPNTACGGSGMCCDGLACAPHYDLEDIVIPPEERCCASAGTSCEDSFDCCGEMLCTEGMCECQVEEDFCWSDQDCCEGLGCMAGTCQPTEGCFVTGETCPTGPDQCCGLDCRPQTWADTAMTDNYICCSNNRCLDEDDCCGEMTCVDAYCVARMSGESCAYDTDCESTLVCTDGTCAPP